MTAAGSTLPTVGFIGIGAMGAPMAACLVKAGYDVAVNDARAAQAEAFVAAHGGRAAAAPRDLGDRDVVITIVPNSAVVTDILFGAGGLAAAMRPGALLIDMTSGLPDVTVDLARRIGGQGVRMFDAPVSGGVTRAATGDLAIMAGGDDALVDEAMPVLSAMGRVTRTGPVGSGHAMKALNNLVSAGGYLIGIEALLIGSKFGIDPDTMVDILNASTGMNNSTQKKFRQFVLSREFNSGFALHMMVKDLSIAMEVARKAGVNAPFAALCREMWSSAGALLGPDADHTAFARLSETLAGHEIHGRRQP